MARTNSDVTSYHSFASCPSIKLTIIPIAGRFSFFTMLFFTVQTILLSIAAASFARPITGSIDLFSSNPAVESPPESFAGDSSFGGSVIPITVAPPTLPSGGSSFGGSNPTADSPPVSFTDSAESSTPVETFFPSPTDTESSLPDSNNVAQTETEQDAGNFHMSGESTSDQDLKATKVYRAWVSAVLENGDNSDGRGGIIEY
ncbi:hypothetical protein M408DRAFT_320995 [Serendipita vermifera MAFF 305830]|uniref:Uncharacterized protein n=1 Tax=Serendipita vermifera MAFF 305830 TaxID=933852 RepID=A0A0C2WAH4_SERVB|nr:hypothetical protein M408DRAFT_320995 [Serendipita vermifera MAFF 305830]